MLIINNKFDIYINIVFIINYVKTNNLTFIFVTKYQFKFKSNRTKLQK